MFLSPPPLGEADAAFYQIHLLEEVDSTNNRLRERALAGAPEGAVLIARRQSAGKGRRGRTFASPPGGLYLSVLLRPATLPADTAMITACAAVCAAQAVTDVCPALSPRVKWVNDVLLDNRKCCGILTESVLGGSGGFAVVGIGFNVNTDPASLPPEAGATSIAAAAGEAVREEELLGALLRRFAAFYRSFPQNVPAFVERYRALCATIGQTVVIAGDESGEPYEAAGVDERFGLVVRAGNGVRRTLRSGEVSVRPFI